MLRSLCLLLIICAPQLSPAQQLQDTITEVHSASMVSVTVDAIYLLLGAVSPGVDIPVSDDWSVAGDFTTGSMLFVKLNSMYSGGVRYYFPLRKIQGMYLSAMYYAVDAEYKVQRVKTGGVLMLGGYRWKLERFVVLDVSTGMNLSPSAKQTFVESTGNMTKSVSLGGSGFSVNARIGIGF